MAWTISDSEYCFFHDPEMDSSRQKAQCKGGQSGRRITLPSNTFTTELTNAAAIIKLLSDTINQTLNGEIDPKISTTVGYLTSIMVRARAQLVLEDRMEAIEKQLSESGDPLKCDSTSDLIV